MKAKLGIRRLYQLTLSCSEPRDPGLDLAGSTAADHTQGTNDFGKSGYNGPMPPSGHGPHHYYFWLLALKERPQLAAGLSMGELLRKIEPLVVGMNRLIGRYERS